MGTAFLSGLNENGLFIWVEWERLFHMGCSWVVNAGGWSTQMGGQRRWVVNAGGWSTQVGDQRRWVIGVAE
jgi:hypothetical protein